VKQKSTWFLRRDAMLARYQLQPSVCQQLAVSACLRQTDKHWATAAADTVLGMKSRIVPEFTAERKDKDICNVDVVCLKV